MDERIRRVYVPMTETGFYILFSLQEEMHGYNIGKYISDITGNQVSISPNHVCNSIQNGKRRLIDFIRNEDKRKFYKINDLGREVSILNLKG